MPGGQQAPWHPGSLAPTPAPRNRSSIPPCCAGSPEGDTRPSRMSATASAPCWPGMPADRMAPTRGEASMSDTSSGPPWNSTTTSGRRAAAATACSTGRRSQWHVNACQGGPTPSTPGSAAGQRQLHSAWGYRPPPPPRSPARACPGWAAAAGCAGPGPPPHQASGKPPLASAGQAARAGGGAELCSSRRVQARPASHGASLQHSTLPLRPAAPQHSPRAASWRAGCPGTAHTRPLPAAGGQRRGDGRGDR